MLNDYRCGALSVSMTAEQCCRWNKGVLTDSDLDSILVFIPTREPDHSYIYRDEVVVSPGLPTTETITLREAWDRQDRGEGDGYYDGVEEEARND